MSLFPQLNCFNHTDTRNVTTSNLNFPELDNEFWQRKPDRIRANSPTKGTNLRTTSSNTHYGRSESREWNPAKKVKAATLIDEYEWNYIAVRQCLVDLGPDGKLITLQWHGDSTRPLSKCQWFLNADKKSARLNWQVAPKYKGDEDEVTLIDNVPLNEVFDLALAFNKEKIIGLVNWNTDQPKRKEVKLDTASYKKDKGLYSKFGVYCQTDITKTKKDSKTGKWVPDQKEGQGVVDIFAFEVYHGKMCDLPNFDETAFWRVGEDASTEERSERPQDGQEPTPEPEKEEPTEPAEEPVKTPEPEPEEDEPAPEPSKDTPVSNEPPVLSPIGQVPSLFEDVPANKLATLQKLVSQVQGNITNGAKKTAKENLSKLEDVLDDMDDEEGQVLRRWCNEQRQAVK